MRLLAAHQVSMRSEYGINALTTYRKTDNIFLFLVILRIPLREGGQQLWEDAAFRQIPGGRFAQRLAEHGDECARALIAKIERHVLHRRPLVETLQRNQDVKLLTPASEAHAGLPFQGASQG